MAIQKGGIGTSLEFGASMGSNGAFKAVIALIEKSPPEAQKEIWDEFASVRNRTLEKSPEEKVTIWREYINPRIEKKLFSSNLLERWTIFEAGQRYINRQD